MIKDNKPEARWALILGGSSGLGLATAQKLAANGYSVFIVHRDRRGEMKKVEEAFDAIRSLGTECISFNVNALNKNNRREVLTQISDRLREEEKISVVVHSIARGNVKPMSGNGPQLSGEDFLLTIDAMAVSLYDWTSNLIQAGLLAGDSRVIAFTSEGSTKAIPYYGAVGAAKAALESICRNMALELAPLGIRVNCIQAGVTETASFAMIPNSEQLKAFALKRNPSGRLTRPEDVADAVYLLTRDEARWITGTVLTVDGGESLR